MVKKRFRHHGFGITKVLGHSVSLGSSVNHTVLHCVSPPMGHQLRRCGVCTNDTTPLITQGPTGLVDRKDLFGFSGPKRNFRGPKLKKEKFIPTCPVCLVVFRESRKRGLRESMTE